jgi:hypothetical protein
VAEFKEPEAKKEPAKPINAKCPVKGEPVNAEITFVYKGQAIGFC